MPDHPVHLRQATTSRRLDLTGELGRIYDEHGYVTVTEYTDVQDGTTIRNLVRIRRMS